MWLLVDVGAVVLLALGLLYGLLVWRKRQPSAIERLRDRKTQDLHKRPDPDENAPFIGR